MQTLHLTYVNPEKRVIAIRAVRALFVTAGMDPAKALDEAEQAVYRYLNSGQEVGLVDRRAEFMVQDASAAFLEALDGNPDAARVEARTVPEDGMTTEALRPEVPAALGSPYKPGSFEAVQERFQRPIPDGFKASQEAYSTALMLMAMTNGSAPAAWTWAQRLARTTSDVERWAEVGDTIIQAFGSDREQQ